MRRILALALAVLGLCLLCGCLPVMEQTGPTQSALVLLPETQAVPETQAAPESQAAPETQSAETEPVISAPAPQAETEAQPMLDRNGSYNSKDEVALYIHQYGTLPGNYITKREAEALGWPGGSLEPYAPGKSIGGDRFGNYEGLLPEAPGRKYTECDIDTQGKSSRGAKRIVFSNDGLIYYTEDHYESFELLYGEVDG